MKSIFQAVATLSCCFVMLISITSPAVGQDVNAGAFQTPALILPKDDKGKKVWIIAATKDSIRYKDTEQATNFVDARMSDIQMIYLYDPREYSAAMDLYQARKYKEAKEQFTVIKERYKSTQQLTNNHSTLAAFYEMECSRRLGDLDALAEELQKFNKDALVRETQLKQIELYAVWDAVRSKNWEKVEILIKPYAATKLPGELRVQLDYCYGYALEGLKKPKEALMAYQGVLNSDSCASDDLAMAAVIRLLTIFKEDADVQVAIKTWGMPKEDKNSKGYRDLIEAASLVHMYEFLIGATTPLPTELKALGKYKPAQTPAG
jgi:hypothetical protein